MLARALLPLLALLLGCPPAPAPELPLRAATVVTFNAGTTEGLGHDAGPDDGYTGEHAVRSDTWYGDGLAWLPAIDAATAFFAEVQADIVVFQEVFFTGNCGDIPPEQWADFVCERWTEGEPTVASEILGPSWQVACHPGKDDKCAAVRRDFGTFVGCDADFCLEGLAGTRVEGCGGGARVGRGRIELVEGGALTLVNVHGSSGLNTGDRACRVQQIDQVFVDLGDGEPGANGARNLVLGDLNTDPGRLAGFDASAARWLDFAPLPGDDPGERPFTFHTEVGEDAAPTYGGGLNIDHVLSDFAAGSCWHPGVTGDTAPVTAARYFDHVPAVCSLRWPGP